MTQTHLPPDVDDAITRLASGDRAAQGRTYAFLLRRRRRKGGWADLAWRKVKPLLGHKDNRVRSITGQVLCGLAQSASPELVERDLDDLISLTRDERFVTARHVLLALWKVGLATPRLNSETSCLAGFPIVLIQAPTRRTAHSCGTTSSARCVAFSKKPPMKRSGSRSLCSSPEKRILRTGGR